MNKILTFIIFTNKYLLFIHFLYKTENALISIESDIKIWYFFIVIKKLL